VLDQNQEKTSSVSMDDLDLKIIQQLEADARQPARAIAKTLGVSRETVRYRLNRLTSEKILRIACVTRDERLGYQFKLVIGVRVCPGCTESVVKKLADLPGTIDVTLTGSRYNILAWVLLRDRREFVHFVSQELTSVSGIIAVEVMHSFHTLKDFGLVQKPETDDDNGFSAGPLSDLELSVIKAMQLDPRQTITDLAGSIGCSRPVARTTLERLIQQGTIGFLPIVNTTALGFDNWVVLLIKAEPNQVKAVAERLIAQATTYHVSLITGQWQVYAVALFQDSGQFHKFVAETMNSTPGITEFEAIQLGRSVKYTFPPGPASASE
jgi:DNA-binding Lrp family transcriptional regulator